MPTCCTPTAGPISAVKPRVLSPATRINSLRIKSSAAPQRRCRVVTSARAQNFAYLNVKSRQQSSASPQTRVRASDSVLAAVQRSVCYQRKRYDMPHLLQSTTKILPELSNLLPFLSAWGALMLSEGAGLPEWLVVRGGLHQAACHAAVTTNAAICSPAALELAYLLSPQAPASNLCMCQQSLHDLPYLQQHMQSLFAGDDVTEAACS